MRKGIVLVFVFGVVIIICLLALGALYFMGNQAYVAEYKIRRMQAYYTAKSGIIDAVDSLNRGAFNVTTIHGQEHHLNQDWGTMVAKIDTNGTALLNSTPINVKVDYTP